METKQISDSTWLNLNYTWSLSSVDIALQQIAITLMLSSVDSNYTIFRRQQLRYLRQTAIMLSSVDSNYAISSRQQLHLCSLQQIAIMLSSVDSNNQQFSFYYRPTTTTRLVKSNKGNKICVCYSLIRPKQGPS